MNLNQIRYVCILISIVLLVIVIKLFDKDQIYLALVVSAIDAFFVYCAIETLKEENKK